MTRRARLIRFIDRVGGNEERFAVTICRRQVTCATLTDDALEDLAEAIRRSFWRTRRFEADSRARYARSLMPAGDDQIHLQAAE